MYIYIDTPKGIRSVCSHANVETFINPPALAANIRALEILEF